MAPLREAEIGRHRQGDSGADGRVERGGRLDAQTGEGRPCRIGHVGDESLDWTTGYKSIKLSDININYNLILMDFITNGIYYLIKKYLFPILTLTRLSTTPLVIQAFLLQRRATLYPERPSGST